MSGNKNLARPGRAKHMKRPARLEDGRLWLAQYTGKHQLKAYTRRYGVDHWCAVAELQLLGVTFELAYLEALKTSLEHIQRQTKSRAAKHAGIEPLEQSSDYYFAHIAGWTSGGFAYGVTWEEMAEIEREEAEAERRRQNVNRIVTDNWSNPTSHRLYLNRWPGEPQTAAGYIAGDQCGGCSFFAPFNSDWGLCCHSRSRHHLETVFEHFTCPAFQNEGWNAHSFRTLTPEPDATSDDEANQIEDDGAPFENEDAPDEDEDLDSTDPFAED